MNRDHIIRNIVNASHDIARSKFFKDRYAAADALLTEIQKALAPPNNGEERCRTCGRTDAEYQQTDWRCADPWHADAHLRAKSITYTQREHQP
ncbi:hypothetical protein LPW26_03335 [Rhodopseudomonas sp. HC1]|uniref:hypothetical protein n=1 Tax=Rhodopseudomonas infernalis TaxID=2897386 RepID=UPI001EE92C87|nr:hypothetical protein [Rhodopseudomonas infernalis]MCG6203659.1 hypothetical protein [Rhodopseudomonas infernalis]